MLIDVELILANAINFHHVLTVAAKARRQTKAVKPKKMIRVDGKVIVSSACNSGSSAVVTQDGEVHVFGKDTLYCDHVTGIPHLFILCTATT